MNPPHWPTTEPGLRTAPGNRCATTARRMAVRSTKRSAPPWSPPSGGFCAYCGISIRDNDPMKCRVEHSHPKSARDPACNWALAWTNLLAACNGGSHPHVATPGVHLEPTADNLSCDAHKDCLIQAKGLPLRCEGAFLDPRLVPAFPSLVRVHLGTGELRPDVASCHGCPSWPGHRHGALEDRGAVTIRMLNLDCDRLVRAWLTMVRHVENQKKGLRQAGWTANDAPGKLAPPHFRPAWPAFFTTLRTCLGPAADAHLQSLGFQG